MKIAKRIDELTMPDAVKAVCLLFDGTLAGRILDVRALIFEEAALDSRIGSITETLKWGQPSYLTEATRSGSTLRLGARVRGSPEGALFVNCQTTLIDDVRHVCGDAFRFDGNRAILIPAAGPLPVSAFRVAIRAALTYHLRLRQVGRGASVLS